MVLLTQSEQFGPKSAHIRPTIPLPSRTPATQANSPCDYPSRYGVLIQQSSSNLTACILLEILRNIQEENPSPCPPYSQIWRETFAGHVCSCEISSDFP